MVSFADFEALNIRVGKIIKVEDFKEARVPAYKVIVDFGNETLRSSAQLPKYYSKEELMNKQIIAVTGFPEKQIANFMSQCLVLGAITKDKEVVLLKPDKEVEVGLPIG